MISKDTEAEILRLYHGEKWPVGTVAKQLGLHHTTVQRVLGQTGVDRKIVAPRPSMVDPFVPFIVEQLEKYSALRASRLFAMVKERGYLGSPDHFRRLVSRLRPKKAAEAFLRLRTLPGEQAQVDWAHFGKLTVGRAQRPLWAFVMVLSFSRRVFLRFFPGAAMPFFLRGHVEAFAELGGVPRVVLYDNLKSAVLERRGDAIRFHPTLLDLSAHYRFEPRPVAVARGNEKGRVERAIRYIREGFFEARAYSDLADLNRQAIEWTAGPSLDRTWVEDRSRSVRQAFDDERDVLMPLPDNSFPAAERVEVEIGKTPYARFDLNDYSVPHDRTQRTLVVFADLDTVRITEAGVEVAAHARSWDRAQQIEDAAHVERLVEAKRRAHEHRALDRLAKAARSSQAFLKAVAERGGNVRGATRGLLQILDAAGPADLEEALVDALEHDAIHLGAIRQIVDRLRTTRGLPPPMSIPIARGEHASLVVTPHALASYDALKTEKSS
jgi:transposase